MGRCFHSLPESSSQAHPVLRGFTRQMPRKERLLGSLDGAFQILLLGGLMASYASLIDSHVHARRHQISRISRHHSVFDGFSSSVNMCGKTTQVHRTCESSVSNKLAFEAGQICQRCHWPNMLKMQDITLHFPVHSETQQLQEVVRQFFIRPPLVLRGWSVVGSTLRLPPSPFFPKAGIYLSSDFCSWRRTPLPLELGSQKTWE